MLDVAMRYLFVPESDALAHISWLWATRVRPTVRDNDCLDAPRMWKHGMIAWSQDM